MLNSTTLPKTTMNDSQSMNFLSLTFLRLASLLMMSLWLLIQPAFAQDGPFLQDGILDSSFNTSTSGGNVNTIVIQPDGKILLAGSFTMVNAKPHNRIARLNADGTLDTTFIATTSVDNGLVETMLVQTDGKIILAGTFTSVNDNTRNGIARLNVNGSLDVTFNPNISGGGVFALALQTINDDERIVIGGSFSSDDDNRRNNLIRLDSAGNLDTTFAVLDLSSSVFAIAVDSNNSIFIGGLFTSVEEVVADILIAANVVRLNTNGTIDTSFGSPRLNNGSAVGTVFTLVVQTDNKLIVGGTFNDVGGATRNSLIRLETNGSLDGNFTPPQANGAATAQIRSMLLQADGLIVLGGLFANINGVAMTSNLARLDSTGNLDTSFTPNVVANSSGGGGVDTIVLQSIDDSIVIGGSFNSVDATPRANIARLQNDIPPQPFEISFATETASSEEGNTGETMIDFTVSRVLPADEVSSVTYTVTGGDTNPATADDFADNRFPQDTLTFGANDDSLSLSIAVAGDNDIEEDETFIITLSDPDNATLSVPITAQGIILNDDNALDDNDLCLPIRANNGNFAVVCL